MFDIGSLTRPAVFYPRPIYQNKRAEGGWHTVACVTLPLQGYRLDDSLSTPNRLIRLARLAERVVPDAITTSAFLLVLIFITALALGNSAASVMDAYYRGLWMLLPFTMQMSLIIVLSSVIAATPMFKRLVLRLARIPRSAIQVVALSVLLQSVLSYFYWGLGVAIGPLIAIHFCREAEARNVKVDFMFVLSAVAAAGSVWQFGLSATAPLLMATPGHFLENRTGLMGLASTIWSPAAIVHEIAFPVLLTGSACLLLPRNPTQVSAFPEASRLGEPAARSAVGSRGDSLSPSERLERFRIVTLLLSAALGGWLYNHFAVRRMGLDLNSLNAIFFLLCLLLHGTVHSFKEALRDAVASSWSVIVIYHLYAGLAGLIQFTTVGQVLAEGFASISSRYTFPLLTALAGTIVAVFVPTSGGQWIIQGFVTVTAADAVGVTAQRGLLALGVGDQMGNLVSPFWYVVLAGIARVDFRKFYGYGLVFAALWFALGALVFTLLPC